MHNVICLSKPLAFCLFLTAPQVQPLTLWVLLSDVDPPALLPSMLPYVRVSAAKTDKLMTAAKQTAKNDFNILVKAQQDSLDFLNNKEYLLGENNNVKKIIESSINLD